jgi:xanthine dehydrogenase accessory factor
MNCVVIRGGGDIASGIAYRLKKSGFQVVILEIEKPMHVRRTVSYAQAIYDGEFTVEGIRAVKAESISHLSAILENGDIPVFIDDKGESIVRLGPTVVVDAILAKRNTGTRKTMASIVIGIGPGFEAGSDVDAVVETNRGHFLGRVIWSGKAQENTGIPGAIQGYTEERVIRANANGFVEPVKDIRDIVKAGEVVAWVNGTDSRATISGVVRGMMNTGVEVHKGCKIGDIDPRKSPSYCDTISDKALSVGGGVLEAILCLLTKAG